MIYIILLLIMTILGSIASLFLKKASGSSSVLLLLKNVNFYIGGFLYFISAIANIFILRYMEYSIVLPLTSITYIWTLLISYFFLKENITKKKMIGVSFIILGALCISHKVL